MLEFKIVKHPNQIIDYLQKFDPQSETWIVSDLKSKQEVQNYCIQKQGYYSDESILRASDFWRIWFRRFFPKVRIVSEEFIKVLVSQYVRDNKEQLMFKEQDEQALYFYISDLAGLLLHRESFESLKEWIEKQEHPIKWSEKVYQARACLIEIIEKYKCISSHWALSLLQTVDLSKIKWNRKIICDLGSQMSSLEMGVFKILGQYNDIEVLVPDPDWKSKFKFILRTYEDYIGYVKYAKVALQNNENSFSLNKSQFLRFATEVNEIKFIVNQIRQWIESGVELNKIAVISPRVEDYWPILKLHFDAEGIPYNKDYLAKINNLGRVQSWLSLIKSQTQMVDWVQLEHLYELLNKNQDQFLYTFEDYKANLSELIDENDLKKSTAIVDKIYLKIKSQQIINRNQFLLLILNNWAQVDSQQEQTLVLQKIIKDFFQQSIDMNLTIQEWIEILQNRVAKIEVKISEATPLGVLVLPINSAQTFQVSHRIWFGLDDSGFRGQSKTAIPIKDIELLKKDFDLPLEYPEESHGDFNLRWYSGTQCASQLFTCAHLSTQAEPLTSSLFFLEHFDLKNDHSIETISTQIDFDQKKMLHDFLLKKENYIFDKLSTDFAAENLKIENYEITRLSPSDLETYSKCSFKFLAQKLFKVKSLDSLGLEVKPRQNGQIIHDLFKYCIDNLQQINSEQLDTEIERLRQKYKLYENQDLFWQPKKSFFLKLANEFIQSEKERYLKWPHLKFKTEEVIKLFFDLESHNLVKEKTGKSIELLGRLDRVDINEQSKEAVIFDYKSNKSDKIHNASEWLKNNEYQLVFYTTALEILSGLDITAAVYFFYKNLKHHYGYISSDAGDLNKALKVTSRAKSLISSEEFIEIKKVFLDKLKSIVLDIHEKKIAVKPIDENECEMCDWMEVCRVKSQRI